MCKFRYYPLNMLTPSKPIAYLDTGAQRTMMDLDILPIEAYKRSFYFITTNCKVFKIEWVTKTPIGIRFFTKCIVQTKVIGSKLANKDILIGMDVYSVTSKLQILPNGIKFKREFKSYPGTLRLFSLLEVPPDFTKNQREIKHIMR